MSKRLHTYTNTIQYIIYNILVLKLFFFFYRFVKLNTNCETDTNQQPKNYR